MYSRLNINSSIPFADINECEDPTLNNCTRAKNCVNTEGSYNCRCPKWHHGNGRKDSEGCVADLSLVLKIAIGKYIIFLYLLFYFLLSFSFTYLYLTLCVPKEFIKLVKI